MYSLKTKNRLFLTTESHLPLAAGVSIVLYFSPSTSDLSLFKFGLPEETGGA